MNYAELTPGQGGRYARSMDNQGEIPRQPEQQSTQAEQGQPNQEKTPSRLDQILSQLEQIGDQIQDIHGLAEAVAQQQFGVEDTEAPTKATAEDITKELDVIQKSVLTERDKAKVASEAGFVLSLGRKWEQDAKNVSTQTGDDSTEKQLKKANVSELIREIEQAQQNGNDQDLRDKTQELASVLEQLSFKPEIREFGYFDVPHSHEELMEYIAASDDPKFGPGGEFPLFEKRPIYDETGKQAQVERQTERGPVLEPIYDIIPKPQNFLRWLMEREDYFIGQNPFTEIKLSQDISVPSVNPITMGYITNNPRFWISERWVPKETAISISQQEYEDGLRKNQPVAQTPEGSYVRFETEYVQKRETPQWLRNLQDEVILNLYLTEMEHNMDVAYFVDGMKNEKPLKEIMEKICNSNFLTRFFPLMMHDPSTSEYHNSGRDNGKHEVRDRLDQDLDLKYQGKLGKAQQRALAMYYHLAEANAAANGMRVEGANPFEKILEGVDVQGNRIGRSEIFYKSLVRQTIEANLTDEVAGVKDLLEALNALSNPQNPNGKRYDWEKIDLVDLLFFNRADLQKALNPLNLSADDVDRIRTKLVEQYNADLKMTPAEKAKRIEQLNRVGQNDAKQQFLKDFAYSGKIGFNPNDFRKKGQTELKYDKITNQWEDTGKPLENDGIAVKSGHEFYAKSGYENIDYFGVKFFASAYDPIATSTQDANIYRHIKYNDGARKKVKQAIADVLVHTEKLDAFEAKHASERSYRRTYFMGISARNDVDSIGHDAGSKTANTLYYRIRQANRATNFYGMEETIFGIRRLSADMFEAINAKLTTESGYNRPLYQMVMGTEEIMDKDGNPVGIRYNLDKDIGQFDLPGNSMKQYFADHLSNALSLWDLISGPHGVDIIGKFQHQDSLGRWVFDHKAFKEFMDGVRKQATYAYDNQGILYRKLTAGWTKETYVETDEKTGEPVPKQRVVFGVRELKDLMFAERVQKMGMYERPDLGTPTPRGTEKDKMARNVLAYLIAAQLKSHRREGREYWNAQAIQQVAEAFRKYGIGILEMADEDAFFLRGFFTPNELRVILGTAEIFLWAIASREYGEDAFSGLFAGIFESFSIIMKEVGAGITLK